MTVVNKPHELLECSQCRLIVSTFSSDLWSATNQLVYSRQVGHQKTNLFYKRTTCNLCHVYGLTETFIRQKIADRPISCSFSLCYLSSIVLEMSLVLITYAEKKSRKTKYNLSTTVWFVCLNLYLDLYRRDSSKILIFSYSILCSVQSYGLVYIFKHFMLYFQLRTGC